MEPPFHRRHVLEPPTEPDAAAPGDRSARHGGRPAAGTERRRAGRAIRDLPGSRPRRAATARAPTGGPRPPRRDRTRCVGASRGRRSGGGRSAPAASRRPARGPLEHAVGQPRGRGGGGARRRVGTTAVDRARGAGRSRRRPRARWPPSRRRTAAPSPRVARRPPRDPPAPGPRPAVGHVAAPWRGTGPRRRRFGGCRLPVVPAHSTGRHRRSPGGLAGGRSSPGHRDRSGPLVDVSIPTANAWPSLPLPTRSAGSTTTVGECRGRVGEVPGKRKGPVGKRVTSIRSWARQESNLRPKDYESPALTTELRAPGSKTLNRQPVGTRRSGGGTRTHNKRLNRPLLCRLSYPGIS